MMARPPICCQQRLRRAVVHHQVSLAQWAGRTKFERLQADPPVESDGGVAERTEGHRDGNTANDIVDDLMPDQDVQAVGAHVAFDLDLDNG